MVYLLYEGQQDAFLTDTPDFTYFKTVFQRNVEHVTRGYEVVYNNPVSITDTLIANLPRNGDYITKLTCKFVLKQLSTSTGNYVHKNSLQGSMYGLDSNNMVQFKITLVGGAPDTSTLEGYSGWFTQSSGVSVSSSPDKKFVFTSVIPVTYLIFDSRDVANFWGFPYNLQTLYGKFVKLVLNTPKKIVTSPATFHQSGWILAGTSSSYIDNIIENIIQSIGLYIGGQLIQEFDPEYIRHVKETMYSYKNRPILDLLENGDTNLVDYDRIYYYAIPFSIIPIGIMSRQDVQIRLKLNPVTLTILNTSMIVEYAIFSVPLPQSIVLKIPQVTYQVSKIKNPLTKLFTNDPYTPILINGEVFCDSEYSAISSYESDFNVPLSSNTVIIHGILNMSRIRDQSIKSNVHAVSTNFFTVKNGLSGLLFDQVDTSLWPVKTGSGITTPVTPISYIFDMIPNSISSMQCFYSTRIVNPNYTGPVFRLKSGSFSDDFYAPSMKNSIGVSIEDWYPNPRVIIWYDQTVHANHLLQGYTLAPSLVKDGKYWVVSFVNAHANSVIDDYTTANNWMYFTNLISGVTQCLLNYKPINVPAPVPDNTLERFSVFGGTTNILMYFDNGPFSQDEFSDEIFSQEAFSWFFPKYPNLNVYSGGTIYESTWSNVVTVNDFSTTIPIQGTDQYGTITVNSPNGLYFIGNGSRVVFIDDMTGTGLITGQTYYIRDISRNNPPYADSYVLINTFKLSLYVGGPAINTNPTSSSARFKVYNDASNIVSCVALEQLNNTSMSRAFNGYIAEFSFMTGNSLTQEHSNYIPMY
jgi:hypothetical protein